MAESIYESAEGYDKEKFLLAHVVEIVTTNSTLRIGKINRDIVDLKIDTMVPSSIHRFHYLLYFLWTIIFVHQFPDRNNVYSIFGLSWSLL
jgi:hypothetical protein